MGDSGDAMMRDQNAAVQARTKAQNRANVLQLKLIGQSHPTGLTNNLLKMFEPRPPLVYKPPQEKRKCPPYTGVAQLVSEFANPGDPEYATPVQKGETPAQRKTRIHAIRLEEGAKKAAEELEKYDPNNDPNISGDPYKTLFVARLNYETSESRIKREFEAYGPIKRIRLITDKETIKPRGYAFIEYTHTRDMKAAYKQADGKKIDNKRVHVDVERGRTVPNWRPRRLGGGLGTTRVSSDSSEEVSQKYPGREQVPQVPSGGISVSEEPRVRDERDRDREKSRDRGREKEREGESSRELSRDRPKDRDHRDDRHHRNRDRNRDRDRDRERDNGRDRERDRTRDRGRGSEKERDRDRERGHDRHRDRERERDRDRDNEVGDEYDRGRPHDQDYDYDRVDSKHERDRGTRDREAEDNRGWPDQPERGHGYPETEHDRGHYEHHGRGEYDDQDGQRDYDRYREADHDDVRYDQMDEDGYGHDRSASDPKGRERSD